MKIKFHWTPAFAGVTSYSRCLLCRIATSRAIAICEGCEKDFAIVKNACCLCAMPLPSFSRREKHCGACLKHPPPYDRLWVPFFYQAPLDHLITRLKFHEQLIIANTFGQLMASKLSDFYQQAPLPNAIIPMPLHRSRLRERGYNQALELARPIARQWQIPLHPTQAIRHRATQTQSLLPAHARASNVKNAFSIRGRVTRTVAVIDDVITTGNTIAEFCKCLRTHGAEHIDVWCLAKTP